MKVTETDLAAASRGPEAVLWGHRHPRDSRHRLDPDARQHHRRRSESPMCSAAKATVSGVVEAWTRGRRWLAARGGANDIQVCTAVGAGLGVAAGWHGGDAGRWEWAATGAGVGGAIGGTFAVLLWAAAPRFWTRAAEDVDESGEEFVSDDPPEVMRPRLRLIFIGWRAGRGTSTQALFTAQALAERGLRVTLVDCDPKQDIACLTRGFPNLGFDVRSLPVSDVAGRADQVAAGSDVVVVDAPALIACSPESARGCIGYADEVVIPVPATRHDAGAVREAAERVRWIRPDARSCALLWGGRSNSRETTRARAVLAESGIDVLGPVVLSREAYGSLTALVAQVDGDAFPIVANELVQRHERSGGCPLGQSFPEPTSPGLPASRRKATRLTSKERREHNARIWRVAELPPARRSQRPRALR